MKLDSVPRDARTAPLWFIRIGIVLVAPLVMAKMLWRVAKAAWDEDDMEFSEFADDVRRIWRLGERGLRR